ncbi:phytanoyl-CoA dioxygenase family protein [Sphingobium indicum]|uniref:phytanoyl-CoA dioxygenase family protein n=1 Tax=Sphingobium indicum TaxID=332055 RepID=UPI0009D94D92|nr:phytanoyl-CoA dioxygenase family protein [Sphingobium indicum]
MTVEAVEGLAVRSVTQEEVEFFFENGWVKLPGLINRSAAAELLRRAKRIFGEDGRAGLEPISDKAVLKVKTQGWFRTAVPISEKDEAFRELASSEDLGRNAARLFGRDSSIRLTLNNLTCKLPADTERGKGTDFHQDTTQHMAFEANTMNIWIALDEVTPDMGAMQFYSGSHKLGNLGDLLNPATLESWEPRLAHSCTKTDPISLQPGDATVHTNLMIHGTGPNLTNRPRWSYIGMYLPADTRYTGADSFYTNGLELKPWSVIDHPSFPVIYEGNV